VLIERAGDGVHDTMLARGSHDILRADTYTDDRDVAKGGYGNDTLRVDDGNRNDLAMGGPGSNLCVQDDAFGAQGSDSWEDTCERVVFR
jgi:hypothetical protein